MTTTVAPANRRIPWIARAIAGDQHTGKVRGRGRSGGVLARTAMEAREAAGLDFDVATLPVYSVVITDDGAGYQQIPDQFAVQRADMTDLPLGIVGNRYTPMQTRDQALFIDTLIDTTRTNGVVMGTAKGGSQTYGAVQLDRTIMPTMPDEAISSWLIVLNSFDGSTAFVGTVVPLRGACTNGLTWTVPGASRHWKIRHTKSAQVNLEIAREQLGLVNTFLDRFEEEVEELLSIDVSKKAAQSIVDKVFPMPKDDTRKRAITLAENRRESLMEHWLSSDNLGNVRDTGYGLLNAVTEWDQWVRSGVRAGDDRAAWNMDRIASNRTVPVVEKVRKLVLAS